MEPKGPFPFGSCAILALCVALLAAPAPVALAAPALAGEYEPGEVIVELAEGATLDDVARLVRAEPCLATGPIGPEDVAFDRVLLELADGVEVADAIEALDGAPCLSGVQANHVYHLFDFDDGWDAAGSAAASGSRGAAHPLASPLSLALAWSPNDPDADRAQGRQRALLEAIGAYDAWELARADGQVGIAVLDTGCDLAHPDLAGNVIASAAYNAIDGTADVTDRSGHGTHVAGIAAAEAGNGVGVAGVSYNARILPVKVVADDGSVRSFDACRGLGYVAEVAAAHPEYRLRVANLSFGGKVAAADRDDQATIRAIDDLARAGVLTVCAAGNTDASAGELPPYRSWPGDFSENVLSVISADERGRTGGSNYNQPGQVSKRICAPGSGVLSTVAGGAHDGGASDFGYKSGTSMASPVVAGVAALVFAAAPGLTPADVVSLLCSSARDLGPAGFDAETGFGLVNAAAAVRAATGGAWLAGSQTLVAGGVARLAAGGSGVAGAWSSSDASVAFVDGRGELRGLATGTAIVSATGAGGEALSLAVTVLQPRISGETRLVAGSSATWKVSSELPAVWRWSSSDEAVARVGDSGLVRAVGPGEARIAVELSSNPSVRASATLHVSPRGAALARATVSLPASCPYTGGAVTPRPTVTLGGRVLRHGADYRLTYRNNLRPGTASVTIEGRGIYTGSVTRTFAIV